MPFLGRRRKSGWLESSGHDLEILPGGRVLHRRSCWCHAHALRTARQLRRDRRRRR